MMRPGEPLRRLLRANRWLALATWILLALTGLLNVLLPLSIGAYYHVVLHDDGAKNKLLRALALDVGSAPAFFGLFALLITGHFIANSSAQWCEGMLGERFARDLRGSLFEQQLRRTMAAHGSRPIGRYLLRYTGDLRSAQELLQKGVLRFSGDVTFLILAFAAMCWIDVRLGTVVIIFFLFSALVVQLVGIPLRRIANARRGQRSRFIGFVSARLQAFRTIRSFNRETPEQRAYQKLNNELYTIGSRHVRINTLMQALVPALFFTGMGVVLLLIAQPVEADHRDLAASDVLGFILLMLYSRSPMRRILRVNAVWQDGIGSLRKLAELDQLEGEDRDGPLLPERLEGVITFNDVRFGYTPETAVLDGFSARIGPNGITRLDGPGGSGKSTVLALVQKLYEPASGTITIDGIDIAARSAFAVRKAVTIVSDDVPLLGGTVMKAIAYNTKEESWSRAAFILRRLKIKITGDTRDDLDFPLEENGTNLSRGQRRMLQFARALLTGKKILLLDEPFQDLDAHGERVMVNELDQLRADHTILLVCSSLPGSLTPDQTIQLTKP